MDKYRLVHTNSAGTDTVIVSAVNLDTDAGIKARTDSFSFRLPSFPEFQTLLQIDDRIRIYLGRDNDDLTSINFLAQDGVITDLSKTVTVDGANWSIGGQDRLERLLNISMPANEVGTVPTIIKNLINRANDFNLGNANKVITAELTSAGGKIEDQAITYPTVVYRKPYTPVFEMIEELSQPKWTGDTLPYISYIDSNNEFNWARKTDVITGSINVGDFYTIKLGKDVQDIVNAVIINGGYDFNGHSVTDVVYNLSSARKGFRWRYIHAPEIAQQLKTKADITIDNTYPYGNSAQYTGGIADTNAQFRTDVKKGITSGTRNSISLSGFRGIQQIGFDITNKKGQARDKVTMTVRGTHNYVKGANYTINVSGFFRDSNGAPLDSKSMRLSEINHSLTAKDGWITELVFLEDELAIPVS